jgi:rhodanese-related sulfurtransferase
MKSARLALSLLITLMISFPSFAQGGRGESQSAESLEQYLAPEALQTLMDDPPEDLYLIDVRTPQEFAAGHIPGAINIDYRELTENVPTEDTDARIILYCRSGNRSGTAYRTLETMGYTNILDWGGILRWPFAVETGN